MNLDQRVGGLPNLEKQPGKSIFENPELQDFLKANKEAMDENDRVFDEERDTEKLGGMKVLTPEELDKANHFIELEEQKLRPFRVALFQLLEAMPNLSEYVANGDAADSTNVEEQRFRWTNTRTHNFMLATVRYLDHIRQLEARTVEWDKYSTPASFLHGTHLDKNGKIAGNTPNLLREIQLRIAIKSPLTKRPDLAAVKKMNLPVYERNPLRRYFMDQIFSSIEEAGLPIDAFEFERKETIPQESVENYLKVVGIMLKRGYNSAHNAVMFSA